MTTPLDPATRPRPLVDAFDNVSGGKSSLAGVVTFLVSAGIISASSGQLWTVILGLIPAALSFASVLFGGWTVVKEGEKWVTPIASPAMTIDGHLVPLVPVSGPPKPPPVTFP